MSDNAGAGGSTKNDSTSASPDDSGGKVTISFMSWAGGGEKTSEVAAIEAFNKSHPNIEVKGTFVDSDYNAKMNTLIAAGDPPDVAYVPDNLAVPFGEAGTLEDLTPYLEASETANRDDFITGTLFRNKGKIYGIGLGPEIIMLYYNKELFNEAGIEPPSADPHHPWTWDQFVEAAQKLTVDTKGNHPTDPGFNPNQIKTYGAIVSTTLETVLDPLMKSNGGGVVSEDGKTLLYNSPESIEVLQKVKDLTYKYHVSPTPAATKSMPGTTVMLQNKQLAMMIDGNWNTASFGDQNYTPGFAAIPMFKQPVNSQWSAPTSMFAKSKHKQEAWEFMQFMADPDSNLGMYAAGTWIAPRKSWYTDQSLLAKWTDNPRHAGDYTKVVVPTVIDGIGQLPIYEHLINSADVWKYLSDAQGKLFVDDKQSVEEILTRSFDADKVKALLEGVYE